MTNKNSQLDELLSQEKTEHTETEEKYAKISEDYEIAKKVSFDT